MVILRSLYLLIFLVGFVACNEENEEEDLVNCLYTVRTVDDMELQFCSREPETINECAELVVDKTNSLGEGYRAGFYGVTSDEEFCDDLIANEMNP